MLEYDDAWLLEELPREEPSELLRTLPELRPYAAVDGDDGEVGLRSLLEDPEALSDALWESTNPLIHRRPKRADLRKTGRL